MCIKKNINPLIGITIILVISIPIILYLIGLTSSFLESEIFKIGEDFQKKDIRYFYKNDYHPILERKSTYDCDSEINVSFLEKTVFINTKCNVVSPFSAIEAFLAVARGTIEIDGIIYYSGANQEDDEKEAFRKRLESIAYPFIAMAEGEEKIETQPMEETNLCFLPCLDGSPPSSFDVLDVIYNPDRNYLSNLFDNYSGEEFQKLVVSSNYSLKAYYEKMEERFEWRYLLGQFDTGKFALKITFDKPIKEIKCQRDDIEPLDEISPFDCEVDEIDEKSFEVKGFASGLDKLIVLW
ncbi:MAG: hypothetical protein AUK07_00965 [Parcubacteria group bacterium CG2_30_36_21]|uniref:Uncharacterized protein n=3 Tax=Candidatus Gribaldobacteria TaxID=2798536 RepID=A0A2M7VKF0_9BACT|nr:MAG: hypothetical protein AUK07_00965 [Parcubacteria group bacterium CG2_30_36_21]PIR90892.1 MAG: hypothetical protein COU02_01750 [bacterium (Candidatus Gribaldobacteria) CG10_big_fil_rev_8_21_14_0_10_37_46]PIV14005.1 MAG: hypothetical protein COS44_01335 [bacterium (Candidatus Gribaldobacteria) CG03_land_8_20_14_0_80_36_40]PJA02320.1 MAG: hypothetical protein COX73_01415 [bacterium (Candidatus Gribaldobacteria) CG_4_10_14_0_2_um_filter_36_18]